ncbi:MAG: hypothetical protein N3A66_07745 [Planctomycetota bacterium]|nr:hypothetical protein [Planctomycetota bacterium]
MAYTFSIGDVDFEALSRANSRCALYLRVDGAEYQRIRFHVPGVDGNYVIRGGRTGQRIVAVMRYIGTLNTVLSNMASDRAAWENTAVMIVDSNGDYYTNCNLVSLSRISDPKAIDASGNVMVDVQAIFTRDS